jgi:hypothetical protein
MKPSPPVLETRKRSWVPAVLRAQIGLMVIVWIVLAYERGKIDGAHAATARLWKAAQAPCRASFAQDARR